jgi:hypothetical protein
MMALNPGRCTRGVVWFVPGESVRGVLVLDKGLVDAEVAFLGGAVGLPLSPEPVLADALTPELFVLFSSCCANARKSASDPSSKYSSDISSLKHTKCLFRSNFGVRAESVDLKP